LEPANPFSTSQFSKMQKSAAKGADQIEALSYIKDNIFYTSLPSLLLQKKFLIFSSRILAL
jgi:restriction endonuclease S subunit